MDIATDIARLAIVYIGFAAAIGAPLIGLISLAAGAFARR